MSGIEIPWHPLVVSTFAPLSWHGLMVAVGVLGAVIIILPQIFRVARTYGLTKDTMLNCTVVVIIGGILGARVIHVADNWDIYGSDPLRIFFIWEGGIGFWGATLGGYIALLLFFKVIKAPKGVAGRVTDIIAIPLLLGHTVGRIGDIINGEHCATATDLPWGVTYTNPASPGYQCVLNTNNFPPGTDPLTTAVHPAIGYEMIWNLLGVGVILLLKGRIKPHGALAPIYFLWYAIGRFAIQWVRLDRVYFLGLQEAHLIALTVMFIAVWYMIANVRWGAPEKDPERPPQATAKAKK